MIEVASAVIERAGGELLRLDDTDWGLVSVDGAAAPGYQVFSENRAAGDGDIVTGQRVSARDLTLSATVRDSLKNDLLRDRVLSFFLPKTEYRITLSYMDRSLWIAGVLAGFACKNDYVRNPQSLTATFFCADPYWNSLDDFGQDIASETPRWGFPYMDNPTYGALVSVYNFAREVAFDYDGDVPAPFVAELTADETVENPKLSKDGAFVRILDTMQAGDVIVINTGTARITKNGENILSRVDRASSFAGLQMNPGTNTVTYSADSGDNNLHVVMRYNKKYLGV